MLRQQPLFRDDGILIGDIIPGVPSQYDIGTPVFPIRAIYADNIIGAITVLGNTEWLQGRNFANTANVNLLQIDASDNTILNADTGNSIVFTEGGVVQWTIEPDGDLVAGAAGGDIILNGAAGQALILGTGSIAGDIVTVAGAVGFFSQTDGVIFGGAITGQQPVATGPVFGFFKTRDVGSTADVIVQAGDVLGSLNFYGADGVAYIAGARIQAVVGGTPGLNDMPGDIEIWNTADAAAAAIRRWIFKSDGTLLADNANGLEIVIGKNSINTADTGAIALVSADLASNARGAYLKLWGNEHAGSPAQALLTTGNGAGDMFLLVPQGNMTFATGPTGVGTVNRIVLTGAGSINLHRTVTAGGTTGAQVIDKMAGTVNFAAGASTLVVTNALVDASSIIHGTIRTVDATAISINSIVAGAGSFTITLNAATTGEVSVGFWVTN